MNAAIEHKPIHEISQQDHPSACVACGRLGIFVIVATVIDGKPLSWLLAPKNWATCSSQTNNPDTLKVCCPTCMGTRLL